MDPLTDKKLRDLAAQQRRTRAMTALHDLRTGMPIIIANEEAQPIEEDPEPLVEVLDCDDYDTEFIEAHGKYAQIRNTIYELRFNNGAIVVCYPDGSTEVKEQGRLVSPPVTCRYYTAGTDTHPNTERSSVFGFTMRLDTAPLCSHPDTIRTGRVACRMPYSQSACPIFAPDTVAVIAQSDPGPVHVEITSKRAKHGQRTFEVISEAVSTSTKAKEEPARTIHAITDTAKAAHETGIAVSREKGAGMLTVLDSSDAPVPPKRLWASFKQLLEKANAETAS